RRADGHANQCRLFIFIFHGVAPSVLQRKASKRYHQLNFKFIFFTPPGKRRRRTDLSFPLLAMAQSAVASYRVFILPASRCAEINKNNARAEE
ncbi:hypothetical protein, partial [Klebsiella pneumoniae]|uniref:hypothetical protein n=2 Tax=Klebsiella pneumoniae TaxID=573 RepID=UPI003850695D